VESDGDEMSNGGEKARTKHERKSDEIRTNGRKKKKK